MSRVLRAIFLTLLFAASTAAHAASYTLSGGPSVSDNLYNDDGLTVYVNNVQVAYAGCCDQGPLTFNANAGDALRVTVWDDQAGINGCWHVAPLYLHFAGGSQVLDAAGVPNNCDSQSPIPQPFYDQTFTIPAVVGIPTLSEWGMIILSSLLALGAIVSLRRQRQ